MCVCVCFCVAIYNRLTRANSVKYIIGHGGDDRPFLCVFGIVYFKDPGPSL